MKQEKKDLSKTTALRRKAEVQLKQKNIGKPAPKAEADTLKLLHELEVHQIELEMQNEELRQAVDKAEIATEKFIELYEFAPVGYFTLSHDGTMTEMNLRGAWMLGKDRSTLANRNFRSFISVETRSVFNNFLQTVIDTQLKQTCDVSLTTRADPSIFVHLEGIDTGDHQRCLITAINITELMEAEKNQEQLNRQLNQLNATKDKLFSIIGHDLKGPITSILMFFKLFSEDLRHNKIEKFEDHILQITSDTEQALILLDNLLAWARTQTGQLNFKPEKIALHPAIKQIVELLNSSAKVKNISIKHEHPDHTMIYADQNMLKTILRNLISNGIKFTNPGGKVAIYTNTDRKQVEITIEDNGIGMDDETRNKLFRLDANMIKFGTANEPGSGLGLILCKELVEIHGGTLRIESAPGQGSKIHFTLQKP